MSHVDASDRVPIEAIRWTSVVRVILISLIVGVIVGLMEDTFKSLLYDVVISNAFGISIFLITHGLMRVSRGRIGIVPALCIAAPAGMLAGGKLATLFGVDDLIGRWIHDPTHQWKSMTLSVLLVIAASTFIFNQARNADYRLELERERRRGAEAGKMQVVAQLSLLQAQIEPHFLFNTLAHVQSAIDQDPALGKVVLEHLICYLRGTLTRSRSTFHTVAEEQELIEALLAIAAIRLGQRLRYKVRLPASVRDARLPPLLLQPLVENAIKHGIEPSIDGGYIRVSGQLDDDTVILRVADTGVGITVGNPEGVGLSNVRERLASLYGATGQLSLQRNTPRGTIAELRVPLSRGA
jgi:signal transduction histidine kinase